jgi:hypothetical protein
MVLTFSAGGRTVWQVAAAPLISADRRAWLTFRVTAVVAQREGAERRARSRTEPIAESVLHPGVQLQRPGAGRSIVRVFRLRDGMDKRSARHASVSRSAICPANSVQGEAMADVADITEERGPR